MGEESTRGFSTSIYVTDKKAFEECKRLLKLQGLSLSEEIMGFVLKRRDELKGNGSSQSTSADYQRLKVRYSDLVSKVAKKDAELKEIEIHYHEANDLLAGLGLKKDFSNANELIPQFISAWKGPVEFMHEYLSLVELARDKRETEQLLRTLRSGSTKENPRMPPKAEEQPALSEIDPSQCRDIIPVAS